MQSFKMNVNAGLKWWTIWYSLKIKLQNPNKVLLENHVKYLLKLSGNWFMYIEISPYWILELSGYFW